MVRFSASGLRKVKQTCGFRHQFYRPLTPCYDGCLPPNSRFMMIDSVQITRLPNGLTILTEPMPELRSVSLGIWLRRGSRHETSSQNGLSHFIEHALFKG